MICPKCNQPIRYGEPTVSMDANMGACAAGAGNWKQYHSACVAIPTFHGRLFGPTPKEIRDKTLDECALLAECAAPNDGRDHAECPFCSIARDIRALKLPITQAAGESADAVGHMATLAPGMESSREGGKPSACSHPWRGSGPEPASWSCCGVKVYRSYEDYVDD